VAFGRLASMDSLPLLLTTAKEERASQQTHFEALDTKAGLILGFASAAIALTPEMALLLRIPVLTLLVTAALCAALGFRPRAFPAIEANALREYLRADEAFTMLTLHDTMLVMISEGAWELRRKAMWVRRSLLALASATPILVAGLLVGGGHG
jgi:hypothetical protein